MPGDAAPTPPGTPSASRFDLQYLAPTACPDRRQFLEWTNEFYFGGDASVQESPAPEWQASAGELAGSVRVKVVAEAGQYTAHLVMVDMDGRCPSSRPAHTETTCVDAARAMAYSLAQALKAPACREGPDAAAVGEARRARPPAGQHAGVVPPAPAAKPSPPVAPTRASNTRAALPEQPARVLGELGLALGVVGPIAEDTALGGALLLGFRRQHGGPSARLAVGYWDAGDVPLGYALRARLWSVGVALCPLEIPLNAWLGLPLCGTAELGAVALSGLGSASQADGVDELRGSDRANLYLWSSLGVAPRLRLTNGWLFAEIEPNLVFPLLRHPLYVHQPSSDVSDQRRVGQVGPPMALRAHLNAGIVFP